MKFPSNVGRAYLLACFTLLASLTQAYDISFYIGEGCRSGSSGHIIGGPNLGCRVDGAGTSKSAIIGSTGAIDDPFMITFFSSKDCNPTTGIAHGDSGCLTPGTWGSYEIWDLSETPRA